MTGQRKSLQGGWLAYLLASVRLQSPQDITSRQLHQGETHIYATFRVTHTPGPRLVFHVSSLCTVQLLRSQAPLPRYVFHDLIPRRCTPRYCRRVITIGLPMLAFSIVGISRGDLRIRTFRVLAENVCA